VGEGRDPIATRENNSEAENYLVEQL
jgi:hypothetical protein